MLKISADEQAIDKAVRLVQDGGLVAFPTETYYGLGVDPFNTDALQRLFHVKKRAAHLPILVLVGSVDQAATLAARPLPDSFYLLAQHFWPGPLTLVCSALPQLPSALTGGTGTIGMRHSSGEVAGRLVDALGAPITATSANISGRSPAANAEQVAHYFHNSVDMVIDGGQTPGVKGSTLVLCTDTSVRCLREGALSRSAINEVLPLEPTD